MAELRWANEMLQQAGLRITAPRVTVLRVLAERPHAAADTIIGAVRSDIGAVSTQAVYNVLQVCTDAGIVRRIQPAGSPARYELRVRDNHHHLVCRSCGTVGDVDCAAGEAPCLEPSERLGFDVDEAEVVFWGICPDCAPPVREEETV
ncbi:MAG: Fur family transcriptional regulator, stress-responsive regulator [Actinomycetota bacterium]|jgi:Fe2+ or Zn2+ uptake regulation protein|nr:Fur family transcriptional regulator, stress-responsive regulator [Actinomycetota bacterium]